jgi:exosome complex protein LRP1
MLPAYLRLNGVQARAHPVFTELTRVKQYFEKIKLVENPVGKRENLSVDKGAASRIIKAGLVSTYPCTTFHDLVLSTLTDSIIVW